jgi:hypothetical protein
VVGLENNQDDWALVDDRYKHDTVAVQSQRRRRITYETDFRIPLAVSAPLLVTALRYFLGISDRSCSPNAPILFHLTLFPQTGRVVTSSDRALPLSALEESRMEFFSLCCAAV